MMAPVSGRTHSVSYAQLDNFHKTCYFFKGRQRGKVFSLRGFAINSLNHVYGPAPHHYNRAIRDAVSKVNSTPARENAYEARRESINELLQP